MVNVDSWRGWCDAVFWADEGPRGSMEFGSGDVVFCKIDEVMRFFERVRLTRRRVVLVTGQGDFPCDKRRQDFLPSNVVCWFATNVTQSHPRITALPLGLGSPSSPTTLTAGAISEAQWRAHPRDQWLYVNFRPETNPTVRGPIFEFFRNQREDWITFDPPRERGSNSKFLNQILRHRFVLCPPGNGVDTHRMWEVLLAGSIPVVLRSQAMEPFRDLPILFVDDYRQVTRKLLESASSQIRIPEVLPAVMREDFWAAEILKARKASAGRETIPIGQWLRESASYGLRMVERRLGK